jgi:translation initiation factor 3 subunit D
MPSFSLPPINDNPDGGWGPSSSNLPEQFKFKDIPYAPYSKSDKLGRFADWNDLSTENRQTSVGLPTTQTNTRGGSGGRRGRDGNQAFGSGTASAFAYFHVEDESSFSLVDNKAAPPRRGAFSRGGRGGGRGNTSYNARGVRGGRGSNLTRGLQRGGRRGWRDWEKVLLLRR